MEKAAEFYQPSLGTTEGQVLGITEEWRAPEMTKTSERSAFWEF
jgi:hypothetical protein